MPNVLILGSGLAALVSAARLTEVGVTDIAIYAPGLGGTPYIAAINFVLPENQFGDNDQTYCRDMLKAGYQIGCKALVSAMTKRNVEGYQLLTRWGVQFARDEEGHIKLRRVSGHSHPRSLCCTTNLIGQEIADHMIPLLQEKGVKFFNGYRAIKLLSNGKQVFGATLADETHKAVNVYAPAVIAAWGGVGNLFGVSTYPQDIKGDTLAIAHKAGAHLVDIEFLEYEPMVVQSPDGAVGEPCPTAMLGEGAYLLNSKGERFLLAVRPEGEAGAPKSLINQQIWKQVKAGNGSPNGGAFVDLRHIPRKVLEGYPWFYNRLMENGVDPCKELVEVGPMAHSFSGGIAVDTDYQSNLRGLYAVGEACGGVHGACRCAGNAASQATLSGLLCAEAVAKQVTAASSNELPEFDTEYARDAGVYNAIMPEARRIAADVLGIYRNGDSLENAKVQIEGMLRDPAVKQDTDTEHQLLSILLMIQAALNRKESRGVHMRTDFPDMSSEYERELPIEGGCNCDCE